MLIQVLSCIPGGWRTTGIPDGWKIVDISDGQKIVDIPDGWTIAGIPCAWFCCDWSLHDCYFNMYSEQGGNTREKAGVLRIQDSWEIYLESEIFTVS